MEAYFTQVVGGLVAAIVVLFGVVIKNHEQMRKLYEECQKERKEGQIMFRDLVDAIMNRHTDRQGSIDTMHYLSEAITARIEGKPLKREKPPSDKPRGAPVPS